MDHLPLPHNPVTEALEIPFLCTSGYDYSDFMAYPEQHEWEVRRPPGIITFAYRGKEVSPIEIAKFLQCWLYFDLIHEVVGEPLDTNSFRRESACGGAILSSLPLGHLISAWSVRLLEQDWSFHEGNLREWESGVQDRILYARDVVLRTKHDFAASDEISHVCLSIALLGEYLLQALKDIFLKRGLEAAVQQNWRVLGHADCGEPIIDMMRRNGWCPNKLAGIDSEEKKCIGKLWYFGNIKPPNHDRPHDQCSADGCQLLQVSKETYKPVHQIEDCACPLQGPSQEAIANLLEGGALPLITVVNKTSSGSQKIEVEVQARHLDTEFIAISHVWADGHGNPYGNSLHSCVLQELSRLVNSLPKDNREDNTPFWIDTICVPRRSSKLRKAALRRLKEPYEFAKHVLILDSYLRTLDSGPMSPIELLARVSICGWTQRLWTFQEGRAGKRVWFQFHDQAIELFEVIDRWREEFYRIPALPSHSVDLSIIVDYNSSTLLTDSWFVDRLLQIPALRPALKSRATSVQSDEALCLASLMGLDLQKIVDAPKSRRMQVFWSLVSKLPLGLVFSRARQKLDEEGVRWAPSSLMGGLYVKRWGGPEPLFAVLEAKSSESGILANLPAMLFQARDNPESQTAQAKEHLFAVLDSRNPNKPSSLLLHGDKGCWYSCLLQENWHQNPADAELPLDQVALVLAYPTNYPRIVARTDEFSSQWSEEGILLTYKQPRINSAAVPAKAHRHVMLQKYGPKETQLCSILKDCADQIVRETAQGISETQAEDSIASHAVLQSRIEAVVRESGALGLDAEILRRQQLQNDERAVLAECCGLVRTYCRFSPWNVVEEETPYINWCID